MHRYFIHPKGKLINLKSYTSILTFFEPSDSSLSNNCIWDKSIQTNIGKYTEAFRLSKIKKNKIKKSSLIGWFCGPGYQKCTCVEKNTCTDNIRTLGSLNCIWFNIVCFKYIVSGL